MKRLLICFLCVFTQMVFGQRNSAIQAKIDSANQMHWNSQNPNLDSLAEPILEKVDRKIRDTFVLPKQIAVVPVQEELPLTPYRIIKEEDARWFYYGQNNLVFNQTSFSNWISGGNDNVGVIAKLNYTGIYKYRRHYWENNVTMGYGFVSTEHTSLRKTEDYLTFMSNYGYELGRNVYLSAGLQFKTQFMPGYNYGETPDPEFENRTSRFMSPGYLNLGLGLSFNPKDNFQIIVRPVSGKFTFVTDPFLQKAGKFGLEHDGQSVRTELGATVNILYRLKIMKGINFDNNLNFFTNYLTHTERVDMAYSGNLNIKFNKFISTIVTLDMVYDHDQIAKLQRKQTLSVGLSYNLGQSVDKLKSNKVLKPVN